MNYPYSERMDYEEETSCHRYDSLCCCSRFRLSWLRRKQRSSSSPELRFVTGGESGTYYAYGTVLAQYSTNNAGVSVNALSSEGSKANIEALQNNEAELAFCQSDVTTYAYEGTSLFEGAPYQDFSVVASLYGEQVQIVTCDPNIKTVADLKGKTVSIGAANSGVYFNAVDILGAYDMTEEDINAVYQNFADSADSLMLHSSLQVLQLLQFLTSPLPSRHTWYLWMLSTSLNSRKLPLTMRNQLFLLVPTMAWKKIAPR